MSIEALNWLFEPRRKLKVKRNPLVHVTEPKNCAIVIQVIRAQNLPVRKQDEAKKGDGEDACRVFVEVSFQQRTKKTGVLIGANPQW